MEVFGNSLQIQSVSEAVAMVVYGSVMLLVIDICAAVSYLFFYDQNTDSYFY